MKSRHWLLAASLGWLAASASAQIVNGQAQVVDGDTLRVGSERVRLFGIDAPESSQTCQRDGSAWRCGEESTRQLASIVEGHSVECQASGRDAYGRLLAICFSVGIELNRTMVEQGWAVAFRRYSDAYVAEEAQAKAARRGIWSSSFDLPQDYRSSQRGVSNTQQFSSNPAATNSSSRSSAGACLIKGNRNRRGQWIYHLPGMPYYEKTHAEEMFCTEAQAQAAGYRRAIVQ